MLHIQQIRDNNGFIEIAIEEYQIVTDSDLIMHITGHQDIIKLLNGMMEELGALHSGHKVLLLSQVNLSKSKVKTIMPKHRTKRGLINIIGRTCKFLFRTSDDKDKINAVNHLNTLNQQIKINNNLNQTFMSFKNTMIKDCYQMLNQLNYIDYNVCNLVLPDSYHVLFFNLSLFIKQIKKFNILLLLLKIV